MALTVVASSTPITYAFNKIGNDTTTGYKLASQWTASETFDCTQIKVHIVTSGSPSGDLWFEIWDDDSGAPGSIISNGTSEKIDASTFSGETVFTFATAPTLTNTNTYYFVSGFDYSISTSNHVRWWGGGDTAFDRWYIHQDATEAENATNSLSTWVYKGVDITDTELVVADIDIDLAFDAPPLSPVLVVSDISHALAFDAPTLTQAHTLVVADADIDLAFDGSGAGAGEWEIGAYIYPVAGSGIILVESETSSLTVSDISLALAFDAPVLTQAHTLAVADAALDLAFEAPVLTGAQTLVVDDVAIALSFESMALTQAHTLVTSDVVFDLSFENIVLDQANTLSVADAAFNLAFDAPVLTQAHTLAVDDADIDLAFDAPVLTQAHTLVVADAALALAFEAPVVTHNLLPLVVADIAHALAFEAPVLTQAHTLSVNDAALALAFDAPVLTQAHTLVVGDVALNLAFESPVVSEDSYELVVGDATVITLKAVIVT